MRYIKVLLMVLVFFLVMMFFVQNQASFSDPVALRFDLLVLPPMVSMPLPMYAIMLLCFTSGALIVLLMLMWDRFTTTNRLRKSRRRVVLLEKQLDMAKAELAKAQAAHQPVTN